jgi:hypothetical protein
VGEVRFERGKGENGSFLLLRKGIGKPEDFPKRSEATISNPRRGSLPLRQFFKFSRGIELAILHISFYTEDIFLYL